MRNVFAIVLSGLLLVVVGCQGNNNDNDAAGMSGDKSMMDACPHCPGVQKMTADGKCEQCGMKMTAMSKQPSDTKYMSADACSHCAGTQTATAGGNCSSCGMKVK